MSIVPRRLVRRIAVAFAFIALIGATYQGVTTAVERHRFVHPGGMVDVGGHQLHIFCTGRGTPTVVLEAPAAGFSAAWGLTQPRVAATTRTCSYDRAGLGWSERGEGRYQPEQTATELRALLSNAGENGPFVVAGEGFGAALAKMFAARFGDDTAALVLIDLPAPADILPPAAITRRSPWLARIGVLRATGGLSDRAGRLPPPAEGAVRAFLHRPDHLARTADELSRWDDAVARADAATVRADVPIVSVDTGQRDRIAFLTSAPAAERAAAAILDAVADVRATSNR